MWAPPDPRAYAHLLGLYLGDGWIWRAGGTYGFRLALDERYPMVIENAVTAIRATELPRTVRVTPKRGAACVVVTAYSDRWPEAFPQHGPGRKHERPIVLAPWQQRIADAHAEQFLAGLIASDGCRCINRVQTLLPSGREAEYTYPRYFFSNESADIRGLFCRACDLLGIRWTQSNARNISVARRSSVARLDAFAGAKR